LLTPDAQRDIIIKNSVFGKPYGVLRRLPGERQKAWQSSLRLDRKTHWKRREHDGDRADGLPRRRGIVAG